MKKRSDVLLAVFLVGVIILNFVVFLKTTTIAERNSESRNKVKQTINLTDDFDAKCKAIAAEFDPRISAIFAEIKALEEEAKKPTPEPSKEQILRELDKLWVAK
jgi:hypothetical protein